MKFDGCININKLPFDFYLPEKNICIEYDGEQHFRNIFSDKSFKETKINDNIKDEFCIKNNIFLIRIPYFKFEEINNILINI